jgi:thiamine biosynthesis lipoprotein
MTAMRRVLVPDDISPLPPAVNGRVHILSGITMGTMWQVSYVAPVAVATLLHHIERTLQQVIDQMSTWQPDSALCRFNGAPAQSWHGLPEEFFRVLTFSQRVAADTGGALDVTAGALVDLWGFGPQRSFTASGFTPPDMDVIRDARECSGWQRLQLDTERRQVLQPGGLCLDLSAVAKGFAVDQISRQLHALGFPHHLVEIGGELRGAGMKADGTPWWVALELPGNDTRDERSANDMVLALHELSVASSGDYRRVFFHDGRRYSHSIDPRTGRPIDNDVASVTVIARECMAADAMSTALMVMGVESGLAFATQHDIAALFVLREALGLEEHCTPAFARLLQ